MTVGFFVCVLIRNYKYAKRCNDVLFLRRKDFICDKILVCSIVTNSRIFLTHKTYVSVWFKF